MTTVILILLCLNFLLTIGMVLGFLGAVGYMKDSMDLVIKQVGIANWRLALVLISRLENQDRLALNKQDLKKVHIHPDTNLNNFPDVNDFLNKIF